MNSNRSKDQESHLPVLDGLRGVAILMVLVHHIFLMPGATNPVDQFIEKATRPLWTGVELFFVLSGFLITRILVRNLNQPRYLANFYMRRILRLVPLYAASLLLFFTILPLLPWSSLDIYRTFLIPEKLSFWGCYMNYFYPLQKMSVPGNMGHYWSLCVEQHFYLIWPVFIWMGKGRFVWIAIGGIILTTVLRIATISSGLWTPDIGYTNSHLRFDSLLAGALAFALSESLGELNLFDKWAKRLLPVLAIISATLIVTIGVRSSWTGNIVGYPTIAATMACVVFLAIRGTLPAPVKQVLLSPPLKVVAKFSYALYIFHFPILYITQSQLYKLIPTVNGYVWPMAIATGGITLLITSIVAWASWHLLEKPSLSLKRFFT